MRLHLEVADVCKRDLGDEVVEESNGGRSGCVGVSGVGLGGSGAVLCLEGLARLLDGGHLRLEGRDVGLGLGGGCGVSCGSGLSCSCVRLRRSGGLWGSDELVNTHAAVRVQHSRERLGARLRVLGIGLAGCVCGREHRSDLRKHTDGVHLVEAGDDVRVALRVLEEEGANVRLAVGDELANSLDDCGGSDSDGLVEPGEERAARDRQREDLRVDLWDGCLGDGRAAGGRGRRRGCGCSGPRPRRR